MRFSCRSNGDLLPIQQESDSDLMSIGSRLALGVFPRIAPFAHSFRFLADCARMLSTHVMIW